MTLKERILGHAKALGIIYDFDSWDEDMLLGLEYDVAIMCIEDEELTHALLRFIDELTIETEDNKHVASKLFKVNYLDPTVRVGFQRVFNALDEEGYGTLTLQSFSRGLTLPPKTCEELFRMSDADNDGEISLEDFFSLMMSSQGSKVSENLKDPSLRKTVKTVRALFPLFFGCCCCLIRPGIPFSWRALKPRPLTFTKNTSACLRTASSATECES
eukprot:c10564_g1_i2.p1 GENE.c10564_g1_i2~~c10564_g1_i2.p1  ORF type:complete len:216 (-),score=40.44 c10564_g1_i2:156-803(-)